MSGAPFKMTGHSLPGPNQASPMKDKRSRLEKRKAKHKEKYLEISKSDASSTALNPGKKYMKHVKKYTKAHLKLKKLDE